MTNNGAKTSIRIAKLLKVAGWRIFDFPPIEKGKIRKELDKAELAGWGYFQICKALPYLWNGNYLT